MLTRVHIALLYCAPCRHLPLLLVYSPGDRHTVWVDYGGDDREDGGRTQHSPGSLALYTLCLRALCCCFCRMPCQQLLVLSFSLHLASYPTGCCCRRTCGVPVVWLMPAVFAAADPAFVGDAFVLPRFSPPPRYYCLPTPGLNGVTRCALPRCCSFAGNNISPYYNTQLDGRLLGDVRASLLLAGSCLPGSLCRANLRGCTGGRELCRAANGERTAALVCCMRFYCDTLRIPLLLFRSYAYLPFQCTDLHRRFYC